VLKILRLLPFLATLLALAASAQTVPVILLSDIHFDPFHDPAKLALLRSTPVADWAAILNAPSSLHQADDFAKLQSTCGAKGIDTPPALLESSLRAELKQQPNPLFITVSGDLMAHLFDCRFQNLTSNTNEADYITFAAKTVAYVALRLHQTFPHAPIYFALGNNDSGCTDYHEDPNSAFLRADAHSFAADALTPANRAAILREFPHYGDYNIALPPPFARTRLIVLQDVFESGRYTNCSGSVGYPGTNSASTVGQLQIDWLRTQLTVARAAHEHVWVMAHIPPGIDPYSTIKKGHGFCGSSGPDLFIPSDFLASTLAQFADVIKLALFGHTHMDEIRIFPSDLLGAQGQAAAGAIVPGKLVPSISPVNSNNPAFTVAAVEPSTATLKDYTVYSASNQTGSDAHWSEEYNYAKTYGMPDFSGTSAFKLASNFVADKTGTTDLSISYQHFYFISDHGLGTYVKAAAMKLVWHAYACSISNSDDTHYRNCLCDATPAQ
jgi:sphingomyelin phosphodiesterase acid-like 3